MSAGKLQNFPVWLFMYKDSNARCTVIFTAQLLFHDIRKTFFTFCKSTVTAIAVFYVSDIPNFAMYEQNFVKN